MSESTGSRGSGRSHPESDSSSRSPRSVNAIATDGRPPQQPSETNKSKNNRRALPSWCYVPPKEGTSTLKKNVLVFGKTVDVYWCPHHERWDTHRLKECPIELQLESYKKQLDIFFMSRQELLETQHRLVESETEVRNQCARIAVLEQKLQSAPITDTPTDDDYRRSKQRNGAEQDVNDLHALQRRLENVEKKSENRKNRILLTESKYKEARERLKEEQELRKKLKKELEEQVEANKRLDQKLQATLNGSSHSNGHYERREDLDKSIYRLSESLATVTGALESERAARITLEQNFAKERQEYEEKLRDAQAELQRTQMLLAAKRQSSATSNRSYRSNSNYVKVCRLLVYSHHNVDDDDKVQQIKEIASKCSVGGFVKRGKPGLIVVEGLEENCDTFLNNLAKQQRMSRESPRKGKIDSATFAAAGKVISQAETLDEGRAFPQDLIQLDSEGGLDELKALCASTGMLDLIDEVCKR